MSHAENRAEIPQPDRNHPMTPVVQRHLQDFFAAMIPATAPDAPGTVLRVTRLLHPLGNIATIDATISAAALSEFIRPLLAPDFPAAVVLVGGDIEDQARILASHGFFRAESMCLMSVSRSTLRPTPIPPDFQLVRLSPADDRRFADAFAEGYALPHELATMFAPSAAQRAGLDARYYAIESREQPGGSLAAVSMCAILNGIPGIYAVATRPSQRGKGLAAHLTAEPLRHAWSDGFEQGLLQSSQMGEPVYRRIGFEGHGYMALYVRVPAQ